MPDSNEEFDGVTKKILKEMIINENSKYNNADDWDISKIQKEFDAVKSLLEANKKEFKYGDLNDSIYKDNYKDYDVFIPEKKNHGYILQVKKYKIRKNTDIFVHNTLCRRQFADSSSYCASVRDFTLINSTRDIIYSAKDVCFSPTKGTVSVEYGMVNSVFVKSGLYYGFWLPENDKGSKFIVVLRECVEIIEEDISI